MSIIALAVLAAVKVASISLSEEKFSPSKATRSDLLDHVSSYEIVELQTVHPYPTYGKRMLLHADALESVETHPVALQHPETGELSLVVKGEKWTVKLDKDYSFFHPEYKQRREHIAEDGTMTTVEQDWSHETHNCFYRGAVYGENGEQIPNSDVVVNSCSGGFSGVIWVGKDQYLIEPARFHMTKTQLEVHRDAKTPEKPDEQLHNFHLLFNAEDVNYPQWRCGVSWEDEQGFLKKHLHTESGNGRRLLNVLSDDHQHDHDHHDHHDHTHSHSHSQERAHFRSMKHGRKLTGNTQYVEFAVINDFPRFTLLGENTETATSALVQLMNANYQRATTLTPSMAVTLIAQSTFAYRDPPIIAAVPVGTCQDCTSTEVGVNDLLSAFDNWRLSVNYQPSGDSVHLFSGRSFESNVLGYAHVGTMCSTDSATGINMMLSSLPAFNAAISTHEMGHNFGMLHDGTNGNTCPTSGFFMNAAVGATPPTDFSSCSTSYYNGYMSTLSPDCTINAPSTQWGEPVCGNGFVDPGEQCDCGLDCMNNPCCNATSCMFTAGSQCNEGDTCCSNCKVLAAGLTCRNSTGQCDVAEVCDGVNGACPANEYAGAGTSCTDATYGGGSCFQGACMSLDKQCGEAGASMTDGPYIGCSKQSYYNGGHFCGTMWCSKGSSIQCSYFNLAGSEVSVADGVPCDSGKQCLGGNCLSSAALSTAFTWSPGPWSSCSQCNTPQSRGLSCVHTENGVATTVDPLLCPGAGQPATTQLCQNATLGCIYSSSVFSGKTIYIPVLKKTISRNILMFSILGVFVLILAMLAACYKAVTYGGTEARLLKQGAKPKKPKAVYEG